jgi:hypothetical protein
MVTMKNDSCLANVSSTRKQLYAPANIQNMINAMQLLHLLAHVTLVQAAVCTCKRTKHYQRYAAVAPVGTYNISESSCMYLSKKIS